jgi:hypothetical protein
VPPPLETANQKSFCDSNYFQEPFNVSDSMSWRVRKIVDLVGSTPAKHVWRNNVKAFSQRAVGVLPGYFRRGAILAAVQ